MRKSPVRLPNYLLAQQKVNKKVNIRRFSEIFIEIDARINRFSYWKRKVHSGIILVSADFRDFSWMMGSFYMNILEISSQSEVISHLDM